MSNFTFLTKKQCSKKNRLNVLKKRGTKAAATDFSIIQGVFASNEDYVDDSTCSLADRTCYYWTSSYSNKGEKDREDFYYETLSMLDFDKYEQGYEYIIDSNGKIGSAKVDLFNIGSRLVLPSSSLYDVLINGTSKRANDGVLEVEYGLYPQQAADEIMQKELERLFTYKSNTLQLTGNTFTVKFNKKYNWETIPEYEYEGQKYIRMIANPFFDRKNNGHFRLSNGVIYEKGDYIWVKVEPVKWLIDEQTGTILGEKVLFASMPFRYDPQSLSDFLNSDIKKCIDNVISKELLQSITINKEIPRYLKLASNVMDQMKTTKLNSVLNSNKHLAALSLFIAILKHDGNQQEDIINYFESKGITIEDILTSLGNNLDFFKYQDDNDIINFNNFRPYLANNISTILFQLFDKESYIKDALLSLDIHMFNCDNIVSDLKFILETSEVEKNRLITEFYNRLSLSSRVYLNDTAKINQLLLKRSNANELLNSTSEIEALAILIASYYNDGIIKKYFETNKVSLTKILDFLDINISKEAVKNKKIDKQLVYLEFKDILKNKDELNVEMQLSRKNFQSTAIIKEIYEEITKKKINGNLFEELEKYTEELKRQEINDFFKKFPEEDREFLATISTEYQNIVLNSNKSQLLKELSIIYAGTKFTPSMEYINMLKISVDELFRKFHVKDHKLYSDYQVSLDILKDDFSSFIKEGDTSIDILTKLFNNYDISLELKQYLRENNISVLSKEEYEEKISVIKAKTEFTKKLNKLPDYIAGNIYKSADYYNNINVIENTDAKKYLSLFLGMLDDERFRLYLEDKGLDYVLLKNSIVGKESLLSEKTSAFELYSDFELFQEDITKDKFIHNLFENNYIKAICNNFDISVDEIEYELISEKNYADSLSIREKKELLENTELKELNPFSSRSLINYSNAFKFHSKCISKELSKIVKSKMVEKTTINIHNAIDNLCKEETVSNQSVFSRLFFGEKKDSKRVSFNSEGLEELKRNLQEQSISIEDEIKLYGELVEYMKVFYQKNKHRIDEINMQVITVSSLEEETSKDDIVDLMGYKNVLRTLETYKNSFVTTDSVFKSQILTIYSTIVSDSIALNSVKTVGETIIPIIEAETLANNGICNDTVIHEMANLFNNLVNNNVDGISENLSNLSTKNLSKENCEILKEGVNKYLEKTSNLLENGVSEKVKTYIKKDNE